MIDLNALGGLQKDERVENDVIYCNNCNTARSEKFEFNNEVMYFRIECSCQKKHRELQERVKEIKKHSLMSERYKNVSFETTKEIKATFNQKSTESEADLINKVATIDFLVIDDIGTESMKKNGEDTWIQEKIYDVLNKRYNAKKPTIFTSNNSFSELVNERGMLDKSVDRIMEMSNVILKFEGQSYRREMRKVALPF